MRKKVPWVAIIAAANVILCGWALVSYLYLRVQVVLANDQTWRFEQSRSHALASKNAEGVADLQKIVQEYPSGTKQSKGSLLDQLVEQQRASAVREVLAHLRKETGKNLGDDPNIWIETYSKN
ncbi:hypothetical protein [Armatimonas rosea]|uniref:Uncharacterized protein n=1 Tax=Armatimonas rosea TaxID=685828 RepID=A0A7W9STL6_ARMRO|nr:hypothetical protein [Armatimonas rosea]MBB6052612.1 hypothetical protein [Armatimonas rosea]